jgi:hypothetical protein
MMGIVRLIDSNSELIPAADNRFTSRNQRLSRDMRDVGAYF